MKSEVALLNVLNTIKFPKQSQTNMNFITIYDFIFVTFTAKYYIKQDIPARVIELQSVNIIDLWF